MRLLSAISFASWGIAQAANAFGDRVASPAGLWTFSETECASGVFDDTSSSGWGALTSSGADWACPGSRGVTPLESDPQYLVSAGQETLDAAFTGFTLEMWGTFDSGEQNPMVYVNGLGSNNGGFGTQVSSTGELVFNCRTLASSGITVAIPDIGTYTEPVHVAFTFEEAGTTDHTWKAYLNGAEVDSVSDTSTSFSYADDTEGITIGPSVAGGAASTTTINMLAIYASALSAAEVTQNYQAFLLNSEPAVESTEVTVNEDVETSITLSFDDLDDRFFDIYGIPASFDPATDGVVVKISDIPANGTLVDINGAALDVGSEVPAGTGAFPDYTVDFTSGPDEFLEGDVYTTFSFTVSDESDSDTVSATVSVNVDPVNDAPVALDSSGYVYASLERVIEFTGYDVDSEVVGVYIPSAPSKGNLYNTDDSGNMLSVIDTYPATLNRTDVIYYFTGDPTTENNGGTVLTTDSFAFQVIDDYTTPATSDNSATMLVSVRNSLIPDTEPHTVFEDARTAVFLTGEDMGGRDFSFVIVSGPSHGTLYTSSSGNTAITSFPHTVPMDDFVSNYGVATVYYQSDENYYNFPSIADCDSTDDSPDTFEMYLLVDAIFSVTETQQVIVANVNDQAVLVPPTSLYHYILDPTEFSIELQDVDDACWEMKLEFTVNTGFFSFVAERMENIEIVSDVGDGHTDTQITIRGKPADLQYLLSDMTYEDFVVGNTFNMEDDEMTIVLYDDADSTVGVTYSIPINNDGVIFDTSIQSDMPEYLIFGIVILVLFVIAIGTRKVLKVMHDDGKERKSKLTGVELKDNPMGKAKRPTVHVPSAGEVVEVKKDDQLGTEWMSYHTDEGETYWMNTRTRRTTWTRPEGPGPAPPSAAERTF